MSNERKWANWKELGGSSLKNYDPIRNLTIYQFVVEYDGTWFDKYIQAGSLDEAKDIYLDQAEEDDIDLDKLRIHSVVVPSNDILSRLTRQIKD